MLQRVLVCTYAWSYVRMYACMYVVIYGTHQSKGNVRTYVA